MRGERQNLIFIIIIFFIILHINNNFFYKYFFKLVFYSIFLSKIKVSPSLFFTRGNVFCIYYECKIEFYTKINIYFCPESGSTRGNVFLYKTECVF
jgi:hypothetical protein